MMTSCTAGLAPADSQAVRYTFRCLAAILAILQDHHGIRHLLGTPKCPSSEARPLHLSLKAATSAGAEPVSDKSRTNRAGLGPVTTKSGPLHMLTRLTVTPSCKAASAKQPCASASVFTTKHSASAGCMVSRRPTQRYCSVRYADSLTGTTTTKRNCLNLSASAR